MPDPVSVVRADPVSDEVSERKTWQRRSAAVGLLVVLLAFLAVRLPLVLRQAGGQDEEYYAFPGLTIVRTGIPQLPHVPQRDERSCFYRADEAFFAEPPLYFYGQSLFYAVLPPQYGTARLMSLTAALATLGLIFVLSNTWYGDFYSGLWAAGLYSLARLFYFPACTARPDMLCAALGLATLLMVTCWRRSGRLRDLLCAGVFLGLAGLTHPFAIVPALQAAVWVIAASPTWRTGLGRAGLLGLVALLTFSLWLPLILRFPEHFSAQFGNNILAPAGPGLLDRLIWPWSALAHHAALLWRYAGPVQVSLMALGLIGASVLELFARRGGSGSRAFGPAFQSARPVSGALPGWSAVLLTAILSGEHPAHGYWSYAGAISFICLGRVLEVARSALTGRLTTGRSLASVLLLIPFLVLMLPGAGLRTWLAHLRHWENVDYRAPEFAAGLISQLPADAVYAVDTEFVLDFHAAGRQTVIAENQPFYFRTAEFEYDYLILSRRGLQRGFDRELKARFVRSVGSLDDPFACYAAIYVRNRDE